MMGPGRVSVEEAAQRIGVPVGEIYHLTARGDVHMASDLSFAAEDVPLMAAMILYRRLKGSPDTPGDPLRAAASP